MSFTATSPVPDPHDSPRLADIGRYGRYLARAMAARARAAESPTFRTIIAEHLAAVVHELPIVREQWPSYEHVNVQAALDVLLSEHPDARVLGITGHRHHEQFGIAELVDDDPHHAQYGPRPGNVTRVALPSGPGGLTRECLQAAVVLLGTGTTRTTLLLLGPNREYGSSQVTVEVISADPRHAEVVGRRLRELALELNVYRGQVVSFGGDMFGERDSLLRFRERPTLSADDLVLPETTFADLRRQVVGVARNSARLRAAGQHLKRGLLLYGPPGVGKTHSVRFLIGELTGTTVVELTGDTLPAIREACSIARSLQPSMIVVEDVDLIAEERGRYGGESPLLFTLLNEMDGLDEDADVVFLLTTNRADLLEPALASRPGRVDQAVHIDLPDRAARLRLIELYRGSLDVDLQRVGGVLDRTEQVTASFLKELLRRSAVIAAERDRAAADQPLRVTADDLDAALDELLDTRNQMTRVVLGHGGDQPARPSRFDRDVDQEFDHQIDDGFDDER